MADLTITPEQAGAFLLAKQYLSIPAQEPLDVVRRLGVIQTQYAANLSGAFFSRCADVSQQWVDSALENERSIVKFWSVRGTLHTVASADLALYVSAYGSAGAEWNLNGMKKHYGLSHEQVETMWAKVLEYLEEPRTRQEIHAHVPELQQLPHTGWGNDVKGLVYRGDVVFATPKDGTSSCFVRRDAWLPDLDWQPPSVAEARKEALRRYLGSHGPARMTDAAYWFGLYVKMIKDAFEGIADELLEVEIVGSNDTYYVLKSDEDLLMNPPEIPRINVLPKFDALMLAHRDKSRHLDPKNHKLVYRIAAQIEATILLDGQVAGTWRQKQRKDTLDISIEPHRKLLKREQKVIQQQFKRLAKFYALKNVEITYAD